MRRIGGVGVWLVGVALLGSGCSVLTGFGDLDFDGPVDLGVPEDASERDLGPPRDAGGDARAEDDTGPRDAGRDAGPRDAGRDAGPMDTGPRDAGPTDAGPDVGPPCEDDTTGIVAIREIARLDEPGDPFPIAAYRVEYAVGDDLVMLGQICVPETPGRKPIALYAHGGMAGLGIDQWGTSTGLLGLVPNICTYVAQRNVIAVMPQFRGQSDHVGASDGNIEYCAGEVDDAAELLRIAAGRCDADASRMVALGHEHGACVTLQMIHRAEARFAAAAVAAGPTDLLQLRDHWSSDPGRTSDLADLVSWIGTDPTVDPVPWQARSPLTQAAEIAGTRVPLMIVHGTMDDLYPVAQACALRDAIDAAGRTFSNFHVNRTGTALATPVTQCPGDAATYLTPWPDVDTPGRFAGDYYFLAFDEPHDFGVLSAAPQAFGAYLDFLLAHIGPLD